MPKDFNTSGVSGRELKYTAEKKTMPKTKTSSSSKLQNRKCVEVTTARNRPWTEGETGSWVSSCCDIDWSRSPWRTAALYSFPGPNKYWNGFQPNTISNSAILSPSGSNTAGCNRQAERALMNQFAAFRGFWSYGQPSLIRPVCRAHVPFFFFPPLFPEDRDPFVFKGLLMEAGLVWLL